MESPGEDNAPALSNELRDTMYRALWGRCSDAAIPRNASMDIEIDRVDSGANATEYELR